MRRLLAALLLLAGAAAAGEVPCPEGLAEAARAHRQLMQEESTRIRDATADAPKGVERVQVFDKVTHDCHDVPAQVYRDFGEGTCVEVMADGTATVHYPFRLLYRKAESVADLFASPWGEGTAGRWQVRFERRDGTWVPIGEREVLDLGGTDSASPPAKALPGAP